MSVSDSPVNNIEYISYISNKKNNMLRTTLGQCIFLLNIYTLIHNFDQATVVPNILAFGPFRFSFMTKRPSARSDFHSCQNGLRPIHVCQNGLLPIHFCQNGLQPIHLHQNGLRPIHSCQNDLRYIHLCQNDLRSIHFN